MAVYLLQTARVVGIPTSKCGSWLHFFNPADDRQKSLCRGQLMAVITISALRPDIDVASAGREVIARIHEEYYRELKETPYERLKKAVGQVISEGFGEVETKILAVSLVGPALYAVGCGGELIIFRQNQMARLLAGEETVSGYVQEGDVFLLASQGFSSLVSTGVLRAALASGDPKEIAETLAPIINSQTESEKAAALIIKVQREAALPLKTTRLSESSEVNNEANKRKPRFLNDFFLRVFRPLVLVKNRFRRRFLTQPLVILQKLEPTDRQRRTASTVAIVLLLILGFSVAMGMREKESRDLNRKLEEMVSRAEEKLSAAESLLAINPGESRRLVIEAQQLAKEIESLGKMTEEYRNFQKRLEAIAGRIIREYSVEGKVFYDLTLIRPEARGNELIIAGDQLIVLDKNRPAVYAIGVKDRKQTVVAGGESLASPLKIAYAGDIYTLTDKGLYRIGAGEPSLLFRADEDWDGVKALVGYDANLYILGGSGRIWKYVKTESGLSAKINWLKDPAVDLADSLSMVVDGSIWLLRPGAKIEKYTQGSKVAFAISGLDQHPEEGVRIFTDGQTENIYLLDKTGRIVVFNKSGEYVAEYRWPGIKETEEIVVSETEKKIFLLSGSKIYAIELK